jgi:hypothetical protein
MNSVTNVVAVTEVFSNRYPWLMLMAMLAVQSTLVIAAAAVLNRFCQQDSAWKHRIWTAVVATLCLIPVFHLAYVGWTYSVISQIAATQVAELDQRPILRTENIPTPDRKPDLEPAFETAPASVLNDSNFEHDVVPSQPTFESTTHSVASLTQLSADASQDRHWFTAIDLQSAVLTVYVIGVSISVSRLAFGTLWLSRLYRAGHRLPPVSQELATVVASQVGLKHVPDVRSSSCLSMPLVFGVFRGVVLVPDDFATWTQVQQRSALLHEMTHLQRKRTRLPS